MKTWSQAEGVWCCHVILATAPSEDHSLQALIWLLSPQILQSQLSLVSIKSIWAARIRKTRSALCQRREKQTVWGRKGKKRKNQWICTISEVLWLQRPCVLLTHSSCYVCSAWQTIQPNILEEALFPCDHMEIKYFGSQIRKFHYSLLAETRGKRAI